MKKTPKALGAAVIIILVAAIVASVFAGLTMAVRDVPDLRIMLVTDVHVFLEKQIGDFYGEAFQTYDKEVTGKMIHLSECIFKSALDVIIDKNPDVLLITGDMGDVHATEEHLVIVEQLRRVQAAGIKVYVIPGNHDTSGNPNSFTFETGVETPIPGTDYDDFKKLFAEFGYNQAQVKDPDTFSYAVDLNNQYRLIALDADPSNEDDAMTRRLIDWAAGQTREAVAQGKVPLGMMHFPVNTHYGEFIGALSVGDTTARLPKEYRNALLKAGMHHFFVGHLHSNDISAYTNDDGTLYEIETAALANYPCTIRSIDCFGDKLELSTESLNYINPEYIPAYVSAADRELILSDFQKFAKKHFNEDFLSFLFNGAFLSISEMIPELFGLDTDETAVQALSADFMELLSEVAYLPIYKKDETSAKKSLERICNQYGVSLPESEYATVSDLFLSIAAKNFSGDEQFTKDSAGGQLIKYSLYSAFYLLADFDIFGRLHALDPDIKAVDLMPAMNNLFTKGELDVVANDLVGSVLSSLPMIKENDMIGFLAGASSQTIVGTLARLSNIEFMGLKPLKYVSAEKGALLLGKLVDELLFDVVGQGVIIDNDPPDNNIVFDLATNEWSPLK